MGQAAKEDEEEEENVGGSSIFTDVANAFSAGFANLATSLDKKMEGKAFREGTSVTHKEAPVGQYQVIATVVEARDLTGVQFFSITQFQRNAESADILPNSWVKIVLRRADGSVMVQRTALRRNTAQPLWESRHYFMFTLQRHELEVTSLTFTVYDQKRLLNMNTKPLMIGSIDVELQSIYSLPGHEVYRKWYTLYETKSRRDGPQGSLQVSIQVLSEKDKPVPHNDILEEELESEEIDEETGQIAAVRSTSEVELYHFHMQLYRGRDLPRVDKSATSIGQGIDPYVRLSCASTKHVASKVKYGTKNPKWNQLLSLNIQVPVQKGTDPSIKVQVYDKDTFGGDDLVATTSVSLRDVVLYPKKWNMPRWVCFYGAPPELETRFEFPGQKQSKLHRKMNHGSVPGSAFRGMVLFACRANIARKPLESRRRGIVDPQRKYLLKQWHVIMVELLTLELFQLEEGTEGKLQVRVSCGNESAHTDWFMGVTGLKPLDEDLRANIYRRVRLPIKLPLNLYYPEGRTSGEQFPDVFVEVWWRGRGALGGSKRRVGFARYPMTALQPPLRVFDASSAPQANEKGPAWSQQGWLELQSDALASRGRGSTTLRHKRPMGIILTRMILLQPQPVGSNNSSDSDSDMENAQLNGNEVPDEDDLPGKVVVPEKAVLPIAKYTTRPFRVLVHVYQAEGLPAGDEGGSSDCYCLVRVGTRQTQTQVFPRSLAPSFFATCELAVEMPIYQFGQINFGEKARTLPKTSKKGFHLKLLPKWVKGRNTDTHDETGNGKTTTFNTFTADMRVPMQPEASHRPESQKEHFTTHGAASLRMEEAMAAEVMEKAALRRPSVPEETQQEVEITEGAWLVSRKKGIHDDDSSSVAGGSEVSSTLSYIASGQEQSDGMVMWWAVPKVHLTFLDAEQGGSDDILSTCTFVLVDPKSNIHPPVPSDGVKRPEWHVLHAFHKLGSAGRVLACSEVTQKSTGAAEGNLVYGGDSGEGQSTESERVVNSNFGNHLFYTFNTNLAQLLSFGGPGVSRLKIQNDVLPVQVDFVVAALRQLQPLGLKVVTGFAPLVEVEVTGMLPLPKAEFVDKDTNSLCRASKTSTKPSSINPTYNAEMLTIRGILPLEAKLRVYLTIRVKDGSKTSLSKMIGSAVLRIDTSHLSSLWQHGDQEKIVHEVEEEEEEELQEDEDLNEDSEMDSEDDEGDASDDLSDVDEEEESMDIEGTQLKSKHQAARSRKQSDQIGGKATESNSPRSERQAASDLEVSVADLERELRQADLKRKFEQNLLSSQAFRKGREVYTEELENILAESKSLPCSTVDISRGTTKTVKVGKLKYLYKIRNMETSWKDETGLSGGYKLKSGDTFEEADQLRLSFSEKVTVLVRVVVLQGFNLVPKDKNNLCDPYLVVSLGSKRINQRKNYQKTTAQPTFYTHFDFTAHLPGQSDLRVGVWDHDATGHILGDDQIGETVIDLEDRWFSPEFQRMRKIVAEDGVTALMPIELRQLYDPSGKLRIPQGQLECWLEMYNTAEIDNREPALPSLAPEEDRMVELRVVIWEAREMEEKDSVTQANDLYFKVIFQGIDSKGNEFHEVQKTDTHWRAQNGRGSFNYRIIFRFPVNAMRQPRLKFQAFDADMTGRHDNIGEFVMSLKPMIRQILEDGKEEVLDPEPNAFNPDGGSKWIDLYHPTAAGESKGQVRVQLALLTEDQADRVPAGPKRNDPNNNPKLPPPERETMTLDDPMGTLTTIVGKKRLYQVLTVLLLCGLCVLAVGLVVMFANDIFAAYITSVMAGGASEEGAPK